MLKEKSSFRDPAGQVWTDGNDIIRIINPAYFKDYHKLMESGLYEVLTKFKLMIPHEEISKCAEQIAIQPEKVSLISYPYEWCFSMLKEAALHYLEICRISLTHDMILKDASAYNMQYHQGRMMLIDTLSFMEYQDGQPWGAYRQFLQHFLYPLLLMAYYNPYMGKESQIYLDGIPAGFVINNLPSYCKFKPSYWVHVYLQDWKTLIRGQKNIHMSRLQVAALINNLESVIKGIKYQMLLDDKTWTNYKNAGSYKNGSEHEKESIIDDLLTIVPKGVVCDLGANTGNYSQLADIIGHKVISVDSNHDCIEHMYKYKYSLPLIVDLCNPSPAIGFENTERQSFLDRLNVDTILALALIHHLCVGNNIPLDRVAEMLSRHCKNLIIEFVPLEDPKAQLLLGKKNIPPYSLEIFKASFRDYFNIKGEYPIAGSLRSIYLMERR